MRRVRLRGGRFEIDFVVADFDLGPGIGGSLVEGVLEHVLDVRAVIKTTQETFAFGIVDAQGELEPATFAHDLGAVFELLGHLFDEGADVVHADA